MKTLIRNLIINSSALWITSQIIPGLVISGGVRGLLTGAVALMVINLLLVPLIRIFLLPLNLLTLGVFAWLSNVLAIYFLVTVIPSIQVNSYFFPGYNAGGLSLSGAFLSPFWVTVVASFIIGLITHFVHWLEK